MPTPHDETSGKTPNLDARGLDARALDARAMGKARVARALEHGAIVLFDGECNVCNAAVQFIIARDERAYFSFASLQSAIGRALLEERGLGALPTSTMALVDADRVYLRSEAARRVAMRLGFGWRVLGAVGKVVPATLRDWAYAGFAVRRYAWFGRRESCWVPTPELRVRFLA